MLAVIVVHVLDGSDSSNTVVMTLRGFVAWDAPSRPTWHLIDGEPQAIGLTSGSRRTIQSADHGKNGFTLPNMGIGFLGRHCGPRWPHNSCDRLAKSTLRGPKVVPNRFRGRKL
jgi:hypothetical protein